MRVFGEQDEQTITQLETCIAAEEGADGVLCADAHLGYSAPIGSAIAYREHVSPSGVGYDIACGNKAVKTPLSFSQIERDLAAITDEIAERISFGMGRKNNEPVEHEVIDDIKACSVREVSSLHTLAAGQLGTVGAGNHYVDLFRDADDDRVWIGVHFGSRGFGHKIATGFLAVADGLRFTDRTSEGEMMSPPKLIKADTEAGESYIECMELAGRYAYAGRDVVCEKVMELLGTTAIADVHNHHNFAWREYHDDDWRWVVRKGATPLAAGQYGFVGATMGEDAVILKGRATATATEAFKSAPHGAGRVMSRTEAAGRRRKRWTCNNRDCDWTQGKGEAKPDRCPVCANESMSKRWVEVSKGRINFDMVKAQMEADNIELRGGAADEAPAAYKRLPEVLAAHGDAIEIVNTLRPIAVVMAGPETRDDYKD